MTHRLALLLMFVISQSAVSHAANDAPIANAAENNDVPVALSLIDRGADVDAPQVDGTRAIHWAAYHNQLDLLRELVRAGADVNAKNDYDVRALFLACQHGNSAAVEMLVKHGAQVDVRLRTGETPLMTAARSGNVACVSTLLKAGAEVNARERTGQTAIMWAAAEGHAAVVRRLLQADAEMATPLKSGFTPFLLAVRGGHLDVVERFLQQGVDVNAVMQTNQTGGKKVRSGTAALMLATENANFEVAQRLLQAGADPNDQRSGFAPLHALSWVRKPNSGDGDDGLPPPHVTGQLSSLDFVRVLVDHGADVNLQLEHGSGGRGKLNERGMTPLMLAADTADLPLMKLLVELGADPLVENVDGATPLMAAAGLGTKAPTEEAGTEPEALAAVEYLLELGADVNAVDANGETAMHGAAYANFPRMVEFLDAHGADIQVWHKTNKYGWTPLIIAQGFRPGNFKPSPATIQALSKVMLSHGVQPPPPPSRNPSEDDRYRKKK